MPFRLVRAVRGLLFLALAHQAGVSSLAAQEPPPVEIDRGDWEFAWQIGLTRFSPGDSVPSSLTVLGLGRHLTDRWSVAIEAGLGSIRTTVSCYDYGSYECSGTGTWPTLGFGTRFVAFQEEGTGSRTYAIAQVVGQGSHLNASYDLGGGMSWRALSRVDVGLEVRHRFADGGARGWMYFFRVSR